ncbi:MAG: polysaccharide deacetylase family protein [Candidatus Promineifilaceae bacterium]
MRNQHEQYPTTRLHFDPIGCVGILLLSFVLIAGVRGVTEAIAARALWTPTPFIIAFATYDLPTVTATSLPTATPEATALPPTQSPPTHPPTATATSTALPTVDTPTVEASATPTQPPPTVTPASAENTATPFVAYAMSPTPTLDEWNPDTLTIVPTPLPTPTGPDSGAGVPILMYHYTSEPPANADKYRTDLSVSPTNLRRQLEYLQAHGYTTIDFYELARGLANQQTLPEKPVILTFDDGYRDNYENAFPLLKAYGMRGVFFIITGPINFNDPNYMTWPMVREMAEAGMSMEIHTVSHPNLATLNDDKSAEQIQNAQAQIAAETGHFPRFLAYPGGDYDGETIQILRALDLWGAVTTKYGTYHQRANRFEWRRVRMRYTTSINEFAALLKVYIPEN